MNADQFNARHAVGTPVFAYPGARPEDFPKATRLVTRTRSKASVLGGHTDVVWVDGHSACIALSHVDVISEDEFEKARAEETAAAVTAEGALPVPVGVQPQPLDGRLAEIAARVERRFEKYCERGQVSLAQLNFMTNDARAALAAGTALLAEVQRLNARIAELEAERHSMNEALSDAAEQLRANRDRATVLAPTTPEETS